METKILHWADRIADQIIKRNPDKEEYVCAAGISPSGSVHIGNFRDVATSLFVAKALRKRGRKARLLFSWDDFDRLRKVPKNVEQVTEGFEEHIGRPYVDLPNPFAGESDCKTYAEYFEREFEESVKPFKLGLDFRYQGDMYRSGKYREGVLFALRKRGEIFDIIDRFRTQAAEEGERERYYPVGIYCGECGRDTTKIKAFSDESMVAQYQCKCGHCADFDFKAESNCKLAWKVDWAMRWQYEGVDFEPGGKDHASPGGSYDVGKVIAKEIFGYDAPVFQGYGFVGIKGSAGKMSGSSGLNLTPTTLLKIYQPEVLLWLYARAEATKEFDFCFDDGILRQYFEFDNMLTQVKEGKATELSEAIMSFVGIEGREVDLVPFSLLAQLGSVVNFDIELTRVLLSKIGHDYPVEVLRERLQLAQNWLVECAPESLNRLREHRNWEVYETLSEEERQEVAILFDYLKNSEYSLEDLQSKLYAICRDLRGLEREDKSVKKIQMRFFQNVYRLLIGNEKGPRLYLFLYAVSPESYLHLLDFSHPKTEEEAKAEQELEQAQQASACPAKQVEVNTDIVVEDFAPEITIEDFGRIDVRVCEVLKCAEIRKSHSCYKITVFDGKGQRVIVSSIKKYYQPEDLIGRKILVVVNLKPSRIAGVSSQGMLLATTFNEHCMVTFVDDIIPAGTKMS
ncbi:MAG: lysine--tRNA ligase [Bacteroidetes bacterium]|nr:MAG: lysine--tRNA ligase [Bacteroidota bacterium]